MARIGCLHFSAQHFSPPSAAGAWLGLAASVAGLPAGPDLAASSGIGEATAVALAEAGAYLADPVLGPRLRECTRLVASIEGHSVEEIFGWPDNLKVRSSMTLFTRATDDNADFLAVLEKFYGGQPDPRTLELI